MADLHAPRPPFGTVDEVARRLTDKQRAALLNTPPDRPRLFGAVGGHVRLVLFRLGCFEHVSGYRDARFRLTAFGEAVRLRRMELDRRGDSA